MTELLALHRTTKRYGAVVANADISLSLKAGEVHALLGENGAGKSTVVKTICGLVEPDSGFLSWRGERVTLTGPADARAKGIAVVFQHFSLFDALTVAENIALGLDDGRADSTLDGKIRDLAQHYGLAIDPSAVVGNLSVGEMQRVEIIRALMQDPQLLVLDEPTSVLTPAEIEALIRTLRLLADEGRGILYISHKLGDIRQLCDRVTVLRSGKVVGETDPKASTPDQLAEMMIGQRLTAPSGKPPVNPDARVLLEVEHLNAPAGPLGLSGLHDLAFTVRAGEIFGIAGVAGNGQKALLAALSGEFPVSSDSMIRLNGAAIGRMPPQARRSRGLAYVPPDRLGTGAVPDLDLSENALLSAYRRLAMAARGLLHPGKASHFAQQIIRQFDVRSAGLSARAGSLSGGNLQKFIVGREMLQAPNLLLAAHPTWGVDAGAAAAIHQALLDLAASGAGALLISEDLDELLALADRIAVICDGRLSPPMAVADADPTTLGLLMAGEAVDAAH